MIWWALIAAGLCCYTILVILICAFFYGACHPTPRYSDPRWQRCRQTVFERDGYRCHQITTNTNTTDTFKKGGPWDPEARQP